MLSTIRTPATNALPLGLVLLLLVMGPRSVISAAAGKPHIVEGGKPNAQIVVPEKRPRMVALAALELQHYIKEISGATLPIATSPGPLPVNIFVGKSKHTAQLGVDDEGLRYGAYRAVSGDNWLVLLGHDEDYTPPEPWARTRSDIPRARSAWNKLARRETGTAWGFPFHAEFKKKWDHPDQTDALAERFGEKNAKWWPSGDFSTGFWQGDTGGSLNAVCGYLRMLGMRWYMPGKNGQVVPSQDTIALPTLDRTVKPDFGLRSWFWYRYASFPLKDVLWARQIGINSGEQLIGGQYSYAHGLVDVHSSRMLKQAHPEYYALTGGIRDTEHRGYGRACHSSPGLLGQTVNFARFMYDHYNRPQVSVWPVDGFRLCQCQYCADQTASEVVWMFVERVAQQLYRTHPDRMLLSGAYTPYTQPPATIEQFSPNVGVVIANRGRPAFTLPDAWQLYREDLKVWRQCLAPNRIIRGDNNRYTIGKDPEPFLIVQATATAKDISMLQGIALGEIAEQSQRQRRGLLNPALNHVGLYVLARYLWDADQSLDALMDEYYRLFYGPAHEQMRTAFKFAEEAYTLAVDEAGGSTNPGNVPISDRITLVKHIQAARETAGKTIFGKRIQTILDDLQSLDQLRQLKRERELAGDIRASAPVAALNPGGSTQNADRYPLKHIGTGEQPHIETTFAVAWNEEGQELVFDIRCEEPDMEHLNISSQVWAGDSVAILLETPIHSYYQIEINPEGRVYDSDRGSLVRARWKSQAHVRTEQGDDCWRVKVSIPVVSAAAGESDPNHNVAGSKPSEDNPWYFNVGRVRYRGKNKTAYTFSPTGGSYHVPEKFGKLVGSSR